MRFGFASSGVALLIFSFLAITLPGCSGPPGKPTGTVEGTVTIDGKPANAGEVVFAVGAERISGAIQADGAYRAVGVPLGSANVAVVPSKAPPPKGGAVPTTKEMPGVPSATKVAIAAKYQKADTSGLTTNVAPGDNKFNIEVSSK